MAVGVYECDGAHDLDDLVDAETPEAAFGTSPALRDEYERAATVAARAAIAEEAVDALHEDEELWLRQQEWWHSAEGVA